MSIRQGGQLKKKIVRKCELGNVKEFLGSGRHQKKEEEKRNSELRKAGSPKTHGRSSGLFLVPFQVWGLGQGVGRGKDSQKKNHIHCLKVS